MVCPACYDNKLQVGWIITKGSFGEIKKQGVDVWISEMQKHCAENFAEHLEINRDKISDRSEFLENSFHAILKEVVLWAALATTGSMPGLSKMANNSLKSGAARGDFILT